VNTARRVYLYAIAFVAIGVLLTGLAGLLQVALQVLVEALAPPLVAVGRRDLRGDVSFSGALTAAGLLVWLIHWWLADRAVRQPGDAGLAERGSALRRLYLYGALLVGGLILLFALRELATDLSTLAFGGLTLVDVISGRVLSPLSLVLTTGLLWLYHWRVADRDRRLVPEADASATLRRWFVYVLAFVGLLVLLFGAAGLIETVWRSLVTPIAAIGPDVLPVEVADRLGSIVAGLALWVPAWRWSAAWLVRDDARDPESRAVLRKVYLYVVLAIAVTWTVWDAGQILYGLLRIALVGVDAVGGGGGVLRGLAEPTAAALVFGVAWLYHARVVGHEAALAGEAREQATIRWLYEYLVSLVTLAVFAVGVGGTLDTVLDLLVQPRAVRPTNWWEDRISLFTTLIAVGLPLWLLYWRRLQREVGSGSPLARGSIVRRIYLLLAFAGAVLTLLFSGAYALYQLIRLGLGEAWTAGQTTDLLIAVSAAAVAALLLVYHLGVFRADAASAPAAPPEPDGQPIRAVAVIRARDAAAYAALRQLLADRPVPGVEVELRVSAPDAPV
jgi:hypothetical protein